MTQVLVLGFNSFVYKKRPRARIFLNDHFVDEIDIPEFLSKFFMMRFAKKDEQVYTRVNRHINNNKKQVNHFDSCPTLFFYELNDKVLANDMDLRIEIKNQDNNYSNGFMTLTTYVELLHLYLIPKTIIDRYIRMPKKTRPDTQKIFSRNNTPVFENLANFTNFTNTKNIKNHATLFTTADSGEFLLRLKRKNNRFVPNISDQYGMLKNKLLIGPESRVLRDKWKHFVFDKYQQYENQ